MKGLEVDSGSVVQEALRLQPQAVEQGCLLAQLYMMRGQLEDALETAAALREAAPQVQRPINPYRSCNTKGSHQTPVV